MDQNRHTLSFNLENENATELLAQDIALTLKPADCFALSGDLGSGKTTFIRALIRSIAKDPFFEVPSPTFTLVQNYELRIPIGHYDLYRILDPMEISELGLEDTLTDGVAFIEWPEMADGELPADLIKMKITGSDDARQIELNASAEYCQRLERSMLIRKFLNENGFKGASRYFLQGDASTRTYEIISPRSGVDVILMNAPKQADGPIIKNGKTYSEIAHLAEDVIPFVAIAGYLNNIGLKAPNIPASSYRDGLLIVEDLGSEKIVNDQNIPIAERYELAIELLAFLHEKKAPESINVSQDHIHLIESYNSEIMQMEIELFCDWYVPFASQTSLSASKRAEFISIWRDLFILLEEAETSLVLRDYHSPNIIWRSGQKGFDQLGIIDFQDALIGPTAYDVASIAQDARVDVSSELQDKLLRHYIAKRSANNKNFDAEQFEQAFAIMAAQRASKILGIFVRLDQRDGKPAYLQHIPRVEDYLKRVLQHRALTPLRNWLKDAQLSEFK